MTNYLQFDSINIYIYIYKTMPRENSIRFQIGIQLESNFMPCISSNLSF